MVEEKGQKVIYGKVSKALYVTLNASLLFCKNLTSTIRDWYFGKDNDGFILNPFVTCVANYMHKLNSKSLAESKLISVLNGINQVLWNKHFLECKGYQVDSSTIYQNNKASILLERNGKRSSKKGTRHINIRYFFITDKVQNREINIEYTPTGEMIADYFTKPLLGNLFQKMRDQIQGIDINHLLLYKEAYDKSMTAKAASIQKQYNMWKSSSE